MLFKDGPDSVVQGICPKGKMCMQKRVSELAGGIENILNNRGDQKVNITTVKKRGGDSVTYVVQEAEERCSAWDVNKIHKLYMHPHRRSGKLMHHANFVRERGNTTWREEVACKVPSPPYA